MEYDNTEIKGSPQTAVVSPAAPNAAHSIATGSALADQRAKVDHAYQFTVDVRDKFDNPVGHGDDTISIRYKRS